MRGVTPAFSACRRPFHIAAFSGEWKAYCVTAAIARNSINQKVQIKKAQGYVSGLGLHGGSLLLPRAPIAFAKP